MSSKTPVDTLVNGSEFTEHDLVFMMGEELKKPLTVIKALAESSNEHDTITLEARRALRTIDNVLLYQRITRDQLTLDFEPVHIGSTLVQVVESLRPLSLAFGCETEVFIQSGMTPVDADRSVLSAGIESLWQAVLGMTERPSPVSWHVFRIGSHVRIAVVNHSLDTSRVSLSKQKGMGKSRQPFAGVAGPATDLVAARGLFASLGGSLTKYQKEGQSGFAVSLRTSPQLVLV